MARLAVAIETPASRAIRLRVMSRLISVFAPPLDKASAPHDAYVTDYTVRLEGQGQAAHVVHFLKQAEPPSRQSNRDLVDRVRAMLDDIEQNRDEAVTRYAKELDRWTKPAFRVSEDEIAAARRAMSPVFKDDFAFCKRQVTDFARRQRDSMHEFEEVLARASRSARRSSRSRLSAATSRAENIRSSRLRS